MDFTFFLGIDVAKLTIDAALFDRNTQGYHHQVFSNDKTGFSALYKWVKQFDSQPTRHVVACLEHTGIYSLPLCIFLQHKGLFYSMIPALQIKRSMGIQRGKNDRVDARMIARYAYLHREELHRTELPSKALLKLKSLLSYRERLVKCKVAIQTAHKELNTYGGSTIDRFVRLNSLNQIQQLAKSISQTDKKNTPDN